MRAFLIAAAAFATLSTVAVAQTMPKAGTALVTADGKRIGRIDRIVSTGGQPVSAAVIYDSRFVYVPISTVTVGPDGKTTTSLTRKEIVALR